MASGSHKLTVIIQCKFTLKSKALLALYKAMAWLGIWFDVDAAAHNVAKATHISVTPIKGPDTCQS